MRRLSVVLALAVCACGVFVGPSSAGALPRSERCAIFTVKGQAYGVYVRVGKVECATASTILRAIAEGKGHVVNKDGEVGSYTLYGGWLCPFGQMGVQTCEHDAHPTQHPTQRS